jgi:hypothetical protein
MSIEFPLYPPFDKGGRKGESIFNMRKTMIKFFFLLLLLPIFLSSLVPASSRAHEKIKVAVVMNDSEGPKAMATGGLEGMLDKLGCEIKDISKVQLTDEEKRQYGAWNKEVLGSKHIGQLIAQNRKDECLIIGLLTNCTDLLGMLAGLQHLKLAGSFSTPDLRNLQREGLAGTKPLRVGLVYFDAHADFNTPETTLSGMLGGMPVAISAGICLTRLRLKAGLDPALPTKYIVFGGLRDVDPLEQELLDRSQCEFLTLTDIRTQSAEIDRQMERLSRLTDLVYVHIDMDVLDPAEVKGHPLTAPEGPTSAELAAAIEKIFAHPKAAAIGIASLPFGERDKDGHSLRAAYLLIEGAVRGIKKK